MKKPRFHKNKNFPRLGKLRSYMQKSADEQKIKLYATKYSHSKQDTPDKINYQVLLESCKIVQRLTSMLDESINS